jgi:hypothetical protein
MAKTTTRRKRIAKGVYRDRYSLSATVKVGTGAAARQREKRFPFHTPLKDIKAWQGEHALGLGASHRALAGVIAWAARR